MIQVQLKLKLRPSQERELCRWLRHLTGVYNWAIRKIELDAKDEIYYSSYEIEKLVSGSCRPLRVPAVVIADTVGAAHDAWKRCFKRLARRPRLKGRRNRLNSIPSHARIASPQGCRISFPGLPRVKFHAQEIPAGLIKCGRIVRRASGWYLCLFIDAAPSAIMPTGASEVGVDPGFSSLLTLSSGEKLERPGELQATTERLAQAQRGGNKRLAARLLEHQASQRKDRNHKLSRRLVGQNALIAWSKDRHGNIARIFGKNVTSSAHGQLRQMLASKCRAGGRRFIEVPSRNSTRTCSACLDLTGPTGWRGLKVRTWVCPTCGVEHDRDVNAAINTLRIGRGMRHEAVRKDGSEIAA